MAERDKQFYMAQEIGILRGRLVRLEASNDHYRALVGERTKALHAMKRAFKDLKRQLRTTSAGEKHG